MASNQNLEILLLIEMSNGEKHYKLNNCGKRIISKRKKEWINKYNQWHREDGPAYIKKL
jgi:hypothetical protein